MRRLRPTGSPERFLRPPYAPWIIAAKNDEQAVLDALAVADEVAGECTNFPVDSGLNCYQTIGERPSYFEPCLRCALDAIALRSDLSQTVEPEAAASC